MASKRVLVQWLPTDVPAYVIESAMSEVGPVQGFQASEPVERGDFHGGTAVVTYESEAIASRAVSELSKSTFFGRTLLVSYSTDDSPPRASSGEAPAIPVGATSVRELADRLDGTSIRVILSDLRSLAQKDVSAARALLAAHPLLATGVLALAEASGGMAGAPAVQGAWENPSRDLGRQLQEALSAAAGEGAVDKDKSRSSGGVGEEGSDAKRARTEPSSTSGVGISAAPMSVFPRPPMPFYMPPAAMYAQQQNFQQQQQTSFPGGMYMPRPPMPGFFQQMPQPSMPTPSAISSSAAAAAPIEVTDELKDAVNTIIEVCNMEPDEVDTFPERQRPGIITIRKALDLSHEAIAALPPQERAQLAPVRADWEAKFRALGKSIPKVKK